MLLVLVVACDPSAPGSMDDAPPAVGSRAPTIVSLTTNVDRLDEAGTLIVTAIVTDPDGINDVIGGTLEDPVTGRSYGAFATSAMEGAYQIDITWTGINAVQAIEAPPAGVTRMLRATFFDVAAHAASGAITITLDCAMSSDSACSGSCVDLEVSAKHCGACGNAVPDDADCVSGAPVCSSEHARVCGGECRDYEDVDHCGTCGHVCPSVGGVAPECTFEIPHGTETCTISNDFTTRASCEVLCGTSYTCQGARWDYLELVVGSCGATPPPEHEGWDFDFNSCYCEEGTATCNRQAATTACETCVFRSCCEEYRICSQSPFCLDYADCISGCTTQACIDSCGPESFGGRQYNSYNECAVAFCADVC